MGLREVGGIFAGNDDAAGSESVFDGIPLEVALPSGERGPVGPERGSVYPALHRLKAHGFWCARLLA